MLAGAFAVMGIAIIIYKFAPEQIQEATAEEIAASEAARQERSVLKQIVGTAVLTISGCIFLLIVPFIGYFVFVDSTGKFVWVILLVYFAIAIFLFNKLADRLSSFKAGEPSGV
jgi:hypothetical protein